MHSQVHILLMSLSCAGVELSRFWALPQLVLHGQQESKGCALGWVCPWISWGPRFLAHQASWQVKSLLTYTANHPGKELVFKHSPNGRGKPLLWEPKGRLRATEFSWHGIMSSNSDSKFKWISMCFVEKVMFVLLKHPSGLLMQLAKYCILSHLVFLLKDPNSSFLFRSQLHTSMWLHIYDNSCFSYVAWRFSPEESPE